MKYLLSAIIITMSFSSLAETKQDQCEAFSEMGRAAMTARQSGIPISMTLKAIKGMSGEEMMKTIILDAYSKPFMISENYKQVAITEYTNVAYLACMKMKK